ncbi:MAG: hypothetical protein CMJ75_00935 [Planctomycetaceae bacterium]|nr:hypothetical protein [Planctomycetaceae bacterium]
MYVADIFPRLLIWVVLVAVAKCFFVAGNSPKLMLAIFHYHSISAEIRSSCTAGSEQFTRW